MARFAAETSDARFGSERNNLRVATTSRPETDGHSESAIRRLMAPGHRQHDHDHRSECGLAAFPGGRACRPLAAPAHAGEL